MKRLEEWEKAWIEEVNTWLKQRQAVIKENLLVMGHLKALIDNHKLQIILHDQENKMIFKTATELLDSIRKKNDDRIFNRIKIPSILEEKFKI